MPTVEVLPVQEPRLACICAWCGEVISRPSDLEEKQTDISHGICPECRDRVVGNFREEVEKLHR